MLILSIATLVQRACGTTKVRNTSKINHGGIVFSGVEGIVHFGVLVVYTYTLQLNWVSL